MENIVFREGLGFGRDPLDSSRSEIDEIQRQLDALRARMSAAERSPAPTVLAVRDRIRLVRNIRRARQLRSGLLGEDLFSDPAWDILLEVYLAELEQRRISISSIGLCSAIPASTTVRWLSKLEEVGLLLKHDDPFDGRRVFVSLTAKGLDSMTTYLDECSPVLN